MKKMAAAPLDTMKNTRSRRPDQVGGMGGDLCEPPNRQRFNPRTSIQDAILPPKRHFLPPKSHFRHPNVQFHHPNPQNSPNRPKMPFWAIKKPTGLLPSARIPVTS